jgi:hypothetical protein
MTRSPFSSLFAIAVLAASAFVATSFNCAHKAVAAVAHVWRTGWDWVTDKVVGLATVLPRAAALPLPQVLPAHLVAMRDYVLRQVRRASALLFPAWRLAPSV